MSKMDTQILLRQSMLSGILIGIGDIINALAGNKYIGALLFSFALVTIIHNALPLYTGKIGFIREYKIKTLLLMLVFNLIGAVIPVAMLLISKKEVKGMMQKVSNAKFSHGFLELFLLGALCGVLMLIAVYSKREIITIFCIMIFILSGFEHCVAAFPYFVLNFSAANVLKFLCIVAGNSVGSILTYELIKNTVVSEES